MDGQSQWSSVKSRLWVMKGEALPSHWAEFTSSHNHLSFYPTCVSIQHPCIYLLLSPSFCSSVVSVSACLSSFTLHLICMLMFASIVHACSLCPVSSLPSSSFYSAWPQSFHICSLWNKKNNPEPWNKLDPTYQYKVTTPLTRARSHHAGQNTDLDKNTIVSLSHCESHIHHRHPNNLPK